MLTNDEYTALLDILQRHVQGRLSAAEALALSMILEKLEPPDLDPPGRDKETDMSNQTRHEQLISAGWRYDASSGRYSAPGSANDGTQRMYDEAAAWLAFQASQVDSASTPGTPPKGTRMPDPRHKEPE